MLMTGFVMIFFGLVTRYAGSWGVPYFSFTSERGSPCTNNLTGYVCEPLTLADVSSTATPTCPNDTKVISGTYTATHDYTLQARSEVPKVAGGRAEGPAATSSAAAVRPPGADGDPQPDRTLRAGQRRRRHPRGEPPSRLFVIGTGIRRRRHPGGRHDHPLPLTEPFQPPFLGHL